MSDLGFNVWGAVASAIGILALIPAFLVWIRPRLPTVILPSIIEIHKETKELLATALNEGLITDPGELYQFNATLLDANIRIDAVRAEVYRIRSWKQDARKWASGLSAQMSILRKDLNVMRIKLAERSSNERKKLASQGLASEFAILFDHKGVLSPLLPVRPSFNQSPPGLHREASFMHPGEPEGTGNSTISASPLHGAADTRSGQPNRTTPKPRRSSIGNHRGQAVPVRDHSHGVSLSQSRPTHHLVSDADLRGLLSLTRSPSHRSLSKAKSALTRLSRRGGQQQHGSVIASGGSAGGTASTKCDARHSRGSSLLHLVRRVYGVRHGPPGVSNPFNAPSVLGYDPESLCPQSFEDAGDSDSDTHDWEECQ